MNSPNPPEAEWPEEEQSSHGLGVGEGGLELSDSEMAFLDKFSDHEWSRPEFDEAREGLKNARAAVMGPKVFEDLDRSISAATFWVEPHQKDSGDESSDGFLGLKVDWEARTIERRLNENMVGSEKRWELFLCLYEARGKVVNKKDLMKAVWPYMEPDRIKGTFDTAVHRLKGTLERRLCLTIGKGESNRGYRLCSLGPAKKKAR